MYDMINVFCIAYSVVVELEFTGDGVVKIHMKKQKDILGVNAMELITEATTENMYNALQELHGKIIK